MNHNKAITIVVSSVILITMATCAGPKKKKSTYDPNQVRFEVRYNSSLDNTLYPSFILGMANYNGKTESELFTFELTSPRRNSVLRIVMDSSKVNYVTTIQANLSESGKRYYLTPLIKWKYDNLANIKQPGMVDLTFTCYINDEEVDVKNIRLNYRSINECLLGIHDSNDKYIDYRWLFAAFVNEEHPYLDFMLEEILQQGIIDRFTGYQLSEKQVGEQVFAIWYYLQTKGIHYSSISNTSRASKKVNTQYIRFLDEVYQNKQANCIDACVFMASILKKIGIYTVIFIEPSHAYIGYYKDKKRKKMALLETTLAGNINLSYINDHGDPSTISRQLSRYSKYMKYNELQKYNDGRMSLKRVKVNISRESFRLATNYNIERFKKNKKRYNDPRYNSYSMLDINELREKVQPIVREPIFYRIKESSARK